MALLLSEWLCAIVSRMEEICFRCCQTLRGPVTQFTGYNSQWALAGGLEGSVEWGGVGWWWWGVFNTPNTLETSPMCEHGHGVTEKLELLQWAQLKVPVV